LFATFIAYLFSNQACFGTDVEGKLQMLTHTGQLPSVTLVKVGSAPARAVVTRKDARSSRESRKCPTVVEELMIGQDARWKVDERGTVIMVSNQPSLVEET